MSTTPDDEAEKVTERPHILDASDGDDLLGGIAGRFGFRERLRANPALNITYRAGVGIVGGLVLVGGIIAIPFPGPGWLIVFLGLAILASEFTWAERVLRFAKGQYEGWLGWLKRQNLLVKLTVMVLTALLVVVILWTVNAFGMVSGWFGVDESWLKTPIPFLK